MRTTIAAALTLVSTTGVSAQDAKPTTDALIKGHVQATGGSEALGSLEGLHRVWTVTSGDFEGTLVTNWSPEAWRSVLAAGDGSWKTAWGSDGQGAWQHGAEGEIVETPAVNALVLKLQADPAALLRHEDYMRRLAVTNEVRLPSGPAWRVLAAPMLGKVMTFFFDKATGRVVGAEFWRNDHEGKRTHVEAIYEDWKPHGPLHLPGRITEKTHLGTAVMTLTEARVRPMMDVDVARVAGEGGQQSEPKPVRMHARLMGLIGDTVTMPDGSKAPSADIAAKPNVLLYFSAEWCRPCRAFTPDLVKYVADNPGDYAILLVSSDKTAGDMAKYMTSYHMPFAAVDFNRSQKIKETWAGGGIPNLVWLGPEDAVIKGSYETDGVYTPNRRNSYVGPRSVLEAFARRSGSDGAPMQ